MAHLPLKVGVHRYEHTEPLSVKPTAKAVSAKAPALAQLRAAGGGQG